MDRRTFLALGAAALAGTIDLKPALGQNIAPLKSYGTPCGLFVGLQASRKNLQNATFAQLAIRNFNLITPGQEFKWGKLHPGPDIFNFVDTDYMVQFAEQHGMLIHATNLAWNAANPKWMATTLTKDNAARYLTDHITTVAKRYAGRIDSWDVVNEPIHFRSGRPDGLRTGTWFDLLGVNYIDLAFHTTASADPKALRVLNVYEVEQDSPQSSFTRAATITLVKQLLARGVPIQAVGLESHLDGHGSLASAGRDAFIKQLQDLGMQILITELDVDDMLLTSDIAARDQRVANYYQNYLESVLSASSCKRVIFFTTWDGDNWLNYDTSHTRADHMPHRSGLWTPDFTPTPSLAVSAAALKTACK